MEIDTVKRTAKRGTLEMDIVLRPYAPDDAAAVIDLWFESWSSIGLENPVVTKAQLEDRLPRELAGRWDVTVAEEDGRLVGFIAIALSEQRLDQLFIAPAAQGHGVGQCLLNCAKQRLQGGFWLSTQPSNIRARAFYEREGLIFDRQEAGETGDRVFYAFRP